MKTLKGIQVSKYIFCLIFCGLNPLDVKMAKKNRTLILSRALHNPGKVMTSLNFQFGHLDLDLEMHL